MANRYWVGGAGNWSSTTKWSASSGGASGATVPTGADTAIFDANSGGKFTATVDTAQTVGGIQITPSATVGQLIISLTASLTTGTLTTTGTAGNNRVFFRSTTYGISINFTVTGAVSISDCDFRGIYVIGASAPISGTRIGNRGECSGITFSTPKTVYWNLAGAQNWSANGWAATSTGAPSTDNFPLPQDTATFTNAGSVTGTITLDTAFGYAPTVDMSGRTTAMTLGTSNATTVYGNWTNGSGTAFTGTAALTFSGGGTQTITSAGKTFSGGVTVDTYGGTVQLADALNIGSNTLTVSNGTFSTGGYAVTATQLASAVTNVRTISLGASTITLSNATPINLNATNLTFIAGTSQINCSIATPTFAGAGLTFYNVSFTSTSSSTRTISGANTFNNLTIPAPASVGIIIASISANQTINGTLTCAGSSAVNRVFLVSGTLGTQVTLTANAISGTDCDFRDIVLAGASTGSSITRAGDCGNNTGITFPGTKTVYWNLAGSQNWSATGWAASSGGAPSVNNFPLAQDIAVFDNAGSAGTVSFDQLWNVGTFDASARTSAMTFSTGTISLPVYGDWKFGTGVTSSSTTGVLLFTKSGTQTITSNGVQFGCPITTNRSTVYVQLADALSIISARTLTVSLGTFDAVTYNVTTGLCSIAASTTLKMGSGTWTLSGTGTVWNNLNTTGIIAGTSTIVLSDTSATGRTFNAGGVYYNKVTIGGTTGTSFTLFSGANTSFGELASTKTVAHQVVFTSGQVFFIGKWSITGTLGNVVTLTPSVGASQYGIFIAGPATSGINYLSISYCSANTASLGEFYVGANSTNGGGNAGPIFFTATPAPRTLYWVGGTGNWSSTTKWSTSSGGASGAAIPTSLDAVVFDSASNATAYTATIDAGVTTARCASFTMAGPASGNVTFAGSVSICLHGNTSFAATGITRSYTGQINLSGNNSYTFTTNGLALASAITTYGIGATWTLGSALTTSNTVFFAFGTFSTSASNYAITATNFSSNYNYVRVVSLNNSAITLSNTTPITFGGFNLTFNAGSSTISITSTGVTFAGASQTFGTVQFTNLTASNHSITGANTFSALTFYGPTAAPGITSISFSADQTIGTLTLNGGTTAAYRALLGSNSLGTQRTLAVTTLTAGAADYDFLDIAITGAAAPLTGTRFGDLKGNSGITFPAAKTVYFRSAAGSNWGVAGAGVWSLTNGGALDATAFPLPQDTAVFPSSPTPYPSSGQTVTFNTYYSTGTIDMSARTSNTMTLATGTVSFYFLGNWINGTGTTISGTGSIIFVGRGSQTITSAGKTFTQFIVLNTPGGSVTLQDAFVSSNSAASAISIYWGTFDAATYNVTLSGAASGVTIPNTTTARTFALGSGTLTISGTGGFNATGTNFTVTGTGTISLTSASAKTFAGADYAYSGITLNQGGAGQLNITGNNTFKDITNTYSATGAATIALAATTTTLTQFTGTGAATRLLTLSGTSAASPATLVLTSGRVTTSDYLSISNVRAYSLSNTWYAGANSTNLGSLGWIFAAGGSVVYTGTIAETATYSDSSYAAALISRTIAETATYSDSSYAAVLISRAIAETATGTDAVFTRANLGSIILEQGTGTDTVAARAQFIAAVLDTATYSDSVTGRATLFVLTLDTATYSDLVAAKGTFGVQLSDSATGTDTVFSLAGFRGAVLEQATGLDTALSRVQFFAAVANTATGLDVVSTRAAWHTQVLNTTSATDLTVVAPSVFNPVVFVPLAITDAPSASHVMVAQLADAMTVSDFMAARFLWEPIDDSQTVVWQNVSGMPSTTWTSVNNGQSTTWTQVAGNTTTWADIDDSGGGTWDGIATN
jgi:hypothetical protein